MGLFWILYADFNFSFIPISLCYHLLNNALYRLKASKSVFDITLKDIVGQYELVTEHMSPLSVETAIENYQKRQKMN